MAASLRKEVLKVFKQLHRTRQNVFHGDENALTKARDRINEEYRKYQHVSDADTILQLNKLAQEVEKELKTTVVRVVEKTPGVYEAEITEETVLVDNAKIKDYTVDSPECTKTRKKK